MGDMETMLGNTGVFERLVNTANALGGKLVSLTDALLNGYPRYSKDYAVNVNGHSVHAAIGVFQGNLELSAVVWESKVVDLSIFPTVWASFYISNLGDPSITHTWSILTEDYYGNPIVVESGFFIGQTNALGSSIPIHVFIPLPYRLNRTKVRIENNGNSIFDISISFMGGNSN